MAKLEMGDFSIDNRFSLNEAKRLATQLFNFGLVSDDKKFFDLSLMIEKRLPQNDEIVV